MPYNPGVTPMAGQLLGQGIASAGQSVAQGIQQYYANKQKNSELEAANTQIIGKNPDLVQSASPETQKLLQKLMNGGGLSLKDNTFLRGAIAGALDSRNMEIAKNVAALAQQQGAQQLQMGAVGLQQGAMGLSQAQLNYQNALRQSDALNRMYYGAQGGQPQQPAGQPAPQANMAPQDNPFFGKGAGVLTSKSLQAMSPQGAQAVAAQGPQGIVENSIRQWVQTTGTPPPPEFVTNAVNRALNVDHPVGLVHQGTDMTTGKDLYRNLYVKADGSQRIDGEPISLPHGAPVPAPLYEMGKGGKYELNKATAPTGGQMPVGAVPTKEQQEMDIRSKQPEQQKLISAAVGDYQALLANKRAIDNVGNAVAAYVKAPMSVGGGRFNDITGSGPGIAARQMMGDNTGKTLEGSTAGIASMIMQSLKNVRNQMEFGKLMSGIPTPTDPADTLQHKVNFLTTQYDTLVKQNDAYIRNLKAGMQEGDASEAALRAHPIQSYAPPPPPPNPVDVMAAQWAQANPNDPRAKKILENLQKK